MKISVTQKHIDDGKRLKCGECPVALAIMDAFDDGTVARVGVWTGCLVPAEGPKKLLEWSNEVSDFIQNFDGGFGGVPFAFELTIKDYFHDY